MPVELSTLQQHFAYAAWASARLVDAAGKLSDAELTRDFGTSDKSVLGTLVHTFAADRVWLARVRGNVPTRFIDVEQDMKMSVLENDWPQVLAGWQEYLAGVGDVAAPVSYKDLKGNPYTTPIWQIALHVVNHGTHHRGQAAGFIRTMGHTPPPLDLIFYYRQL
jgi:uncharacterized damage-inducible protein DinB